LGNSLLPNTAQKLSLAISRPSINAASLSLAGQN
jgi:hypothetical protein